MGYRDVGYFHYLISRKVAVAKVIKVENVDKNYPRRYVATVTFYNLYKKEIDTLGVIYEKKDSIPKIMEILYSKSKLVFVREQQQITWGTFVWTSLIILVLFYGLFIITLSIRTQ